MNELSKISVVLPSLDPDEKLTAVIDGLLEYGFSHIILVNDGSKPENLHYFLDAAAQHPEITLLHHEVNRGKGAALKTAFQWFLENRPESAGVVTVDGDNQHHPEDTKNCALHMLKTNHLVLGVRDFSQPDVPFRSRAGNRITSAVFKIFVGMTISDTQTGLRAIPAAMLQRMLLTQGDRFEYETNMLLALQKFNLPYDEVKIRTVYIEENKSSHFRAVRDSWRIYKLILAHFFRYTISALLSSVLELAIYAGMSELLYRSMSPLALDSACTVTARMLSSLANFYMNQRLVFRSTAKTGTAMLRYYILVIPALVAQLLLTHGIYQLFHIQPEQTLARTLIYTIIMVVLFVVNFCVQQRWVFRNSNSSKQMEDDL